MRRRILPRVLSLAPLAAPLAAQTALPDGTYRCQLYSGGMVMHLGDIRLSGGTFSGPAYDGAYEGAYPYTVTPAGTIDWGGPLGGMSSGGMNVVSTVLVDAGGGQTGFDVTVQQPSGTFTTVSCSPE